MERHKTFIDATAKVLADSRRVKFTVSTGDVDRDNDTVRQSGWQLANYRKNPVVLWAHDHSELPIAKCVEMSIEHGNLTAVCEFAAHAFADTVFELVKGGFLSATSVGFRAMKWAHNTERDGIDFLEQELIEYSVVPCPANQNALVSASKAGIDTTLVKAWAKRVLRGDDGGSVLDIDNSPVVLDIVDFPNRMNPAVRAGLVQDELDVDPATFRRAMREGIREALNAVVRESVAYEIRVARGRVD